MGVPRLRRHTLTAAARQPVLSVTALTVADVKESDGVREAVRLEDATLPLCPRCRAAHLRRLGPGDFGFWECACGFYAAHL